MPLVRLLHLVAVFASITSCKPTEAQIRDELEAANHCVLPSDCVSAGSVCPFGCYILVNASELERVKSLLDDYGSNCAYDCVASAGIDCQQNECVLLEAAP